MFSKPVEKTNNEEVENLTEFWHPPPSKNKSLLGSMIVPWGYSIYSGIVEVREGGDFPWFLVISMTIFVSLAVAFFIYKLMPTLKITKEGVESYFFNKKHKAFT